jgi:hypothetical protein
MPRFEVEEIATYLVTAATKKEAEQAVINNDVERLTVHVTAQITGECEPDCECEICL